MNFNTYLNQAWTDHATQSPAVAAGFDDAAKLVESNDHIVQLAGLYTHVMGEHLHRWQDGVALLQSLKKNPHFVAGSESEKAIDRSVAALSLAGGTAGDLSKFDIGGQIRVYAVAASAVATANSATATVLLTKALDLAKEGLDPKD